MMNISTNTLLFALVVALVGFVVTFAPRLRRVSLEALRIGPVSLGPIRFFFASPRPRAALPSGGPALLPSRSQPRVKRRAPKNRARTT
jgi:hypothetical protein